MTIGKKIIFILLTLFLGLAVGILIAEFFASFFLPKPQPHRLPLIRMAVDSDVGYLHEPNQKAYSSGGLTEINEFGFRGPDWTIEKPSGVTRIALLGDSYTFAQGMDDNETYGYQLEEKLTAKGKNVEVMNFAASGYDTGHEIAVLRKYALQFQPDVVILQFFINDVFYIGNYEFYAELFKKNQAKFHPVKWHLMEIARKSRIMMTVWDLMHSFKPSLPRQMIKAYVDEGKSPSEGPMKKEWRFIQKKLKEFGEIAKEQGFEIYVLVLPTPQEMVDPSIETQYQTYIENLGKEYGFKTIDIEPALHRAEVNAMDLLIPYDFHFNAKGNELIADVLVESLQI